MNELKLNQADIKRIKEDIRLTTIIGLIFTIALIVITLIIPTILLLFFKPADGFVTRALIVSGTFFLLFLGISWKNFVKYIDLRIGKKINIKTGDYEIEKAKEGFVLKTKSPLKLKLDLWDEMPPLIKNAEPITFEITKLSKTLLYISQDTVNLLEKIENETEKEIQDKFD